MVKEIKEKDFNDVIKNGNVLIDCYATWCGPCRMLSPILDEISNEESTYKFYKLDVDESSNIAKEYKIMSIPTILLFNDGKLKETVVGLKSKNEIKELLK